MSKIPTVLGELLMVLSDPEISLTVEQLELLGAAVDFSHDKGEGGIGWHYTSNLEAGKYFLEFFRKGREDCE